MPRAAGAPILLHVRVVARAEDSRGLAAGTIPPRLRERKKASCDHIRKSLPHPPTVWTGCIVQYTAPAMRLFALLLSFCCLLVAACSGQPADRGPVVLAAASMQDALEQAADEWEGQGHARPLLSFAASSALARQVASGAPADIFVSADMEWMDWLEERDLIDPASRVIVASNLLVLVGPTGAGDAAGSDSIETLLAGLGTERLAMADPQAVPAGRYGQAALESLGLWQSVADRVVPAENVRAALALVERGEAPLGIVYATDAHASGRVRIRAIFPPSSHPPILYPAALLAGSAHEDAPAFLAFLTAPEGQAILAANGFGAAP